MVATRDANDVQTLPPVPKNPLPLLATLRALRSFNTGFERLRDAGGPVTRLTLGPAWLVPPMVVVTSPQGGRDMLGRTDAFVDKNRVHEEFRNLLGGNLFSFMHDEWLPRRRSLQHIFTKQHVREFGGHMAQAAESICDTWLDKNVVDLDTECRRLTLRALGRSVLGVDLDQRSTVIAESLAVAATYVADRGMRPVSAPRWLPTPARRRARRAAATLHSLAMEMLTACRRDPGREAPLIRALMAATDQATGRTLSDDEICQELILFMLAGHDTTSTTLTYALWQLGRHRDLQDRVRAEVDALGHRTLTAEDAQHLTYTVQVLHEALRLCPPAAAVGRVAIRDIDVDGYRVEAGTLLGFGIWAVHRDPALWVEPKRFDPDRFAPERMKRIDRWQYLPFGAGPRSCIGDHFAMLEATLALATIIGRCDVVSLVDDFAVKVPFTAVAAAPVTARVSPR